MTLNCRRPWVRIAMMMLSLAVGGTVMGSSCASDIKDNIKAGALDFTKATVKDLLSMILPITDLLTPPK